MTKKEKILEIICLINQFDENPVVQNVIDDQIFKKMEDIGLTDAEQDNYWEFYQNYKNLVFDKNGCIIDFKEIKND